MSDLIDRQAIMKEFADFVRKSNNSDFAQTPTWNDAVSLVGSMPSAQPETNCSEFPNNSDTISRQAAIEAIDAVFPVDPMKSEYAQGISCGAALAKTYVEQLPSSQPGQHTCVNCGRTVNNGGWYADGGTRCPIEEHYALPKDGYCHLWEKRNVTDDDYPERREDERPES